MQIVFDSREVQKIYEILGRELANLRSEIRLVGAAGGKKQLVDEEALLVIMHKKFAVAVLFAPQSKDSRLRHSSDDFNFCLNSSTSDFDR